MCPQAWRRAGPAAAALLERTRILLADQLGQGVVVEDKAGAGGQIAAQALKAAAPDGTAFFISHDHTISILPLVTENPENHKAGKIRVVAVMGNARQAAVPEAPTFAEMGLAGFEDVPYYGFFAPAGTPQAAIDRFAGALQKVVALPDVRDHLTRLGLTVGFMPQQQLTERERAYSQTWARIIRASGFQPQ